jgi:3-phenylpropionate/trans-cinnamate dioxygenase ferredoxin reductase component
VTTPDSVVVVGGGLAGANAALTLRKLGYDGRVVIVSAEDELPYERPPLSKDYLRGESPLEKAYVKPGTDYDDQAIELLRGRTATAIDVGGKRVELDAREHVDFGALVLATGSAPRPLEVPGADLPHVRYLRTVGDSDAIRAAASAADRVVVIGGGWIGSEVAASLRQLGHDVTMIIRTDRPLERVLGPEVADLYRQLHVENGVHLVTGNVAAVTADAVLLKGGERVRADLVVAGIGATPRIDLARAAGLELHHGAVSVDEFLRTSAPGVYAVGDIALAWHPRLRRHVRVEHWDNAKRQGRAVGATILGQGEPYERTPYFYSDQFDLGMEYRGFAPEWDKVVFRGDTGAREFDAFWLRNGKVVAAMNANRWDDGAELEALVESGNRVDIGRLADPSVKLAEAA